MRFESKVAVITGGASGIGAATARLLAAEGAQVVIGDVQTDLGSVLAAEIGGDFVHVDVAERSQVEALVAHAAESHGGLDICSTTRASAALARPLIWIQTTGGGSSPSTSMRSSTPAG
jgi:NAD(P)-dependent dehydrogenase (short-subunit alcohol dehydrogenase family)